MKKQDHVIVAIHVTDRVHQAGSVQEILTRYGRNIKTRIGLHEPNTRGTSSNGIILLELAGTKKSAMPLITELKKMKGIETKSVVFYHS